MLFKIAGKDTYFTPVIVDVPDGTGKGTKHTFKVQFKRLTQPELIEVFRRVDPLKLNEGEELLRDRELLEDVMVGWEGVQDTNGNDVEFNQENMAALLDIYPVQPTIVSAFFDSIKTGKRKN
jgi:hypothetical protein